MIKIFSRKRMEKLLSSGKSIKKFAIINFVDTDLEPINYAGKTDRVFTILLDDIGKDELKDYGLTYEQFFKEADDLAEFIYQSKSDGYNLIVQCTYGESRSTGCAAAILEHFERNGIAIFANYSYFPNRLIYHKIHEALEKYRAKNKSAVEP